MSSAWSDSSLRRAPAAGLSDVYADLRDSGGVDEVWAVREILKLEEDPFLGHPLQGGLRGTRAPGFNLKGGGGVYRAFHTMDFGRQVLSRDL